MLITEVDSSSVRVSVLDDTGKLKDFGWVDNATLVGWTLSKFDWSPCLEDG